MRRLPDFLVIGAMKSGTTSLYQDLRSQDQSYFPPGEKEPAALIDDHVLTAEGQRRYSRLYRRATEDQLCGDASTGYSKRPDFEGVAGRARRLLGPDLRVIYIVREPIARTISHHYHEFARGRISNAVDEAIQRYPRLVDYSRYAYQLRPWLTEFSSSRIRIVRFEDYIANRVDTVGSLCNFLEIGFRPEQVAENRIFNSREELPIPQGPAWRLSRGALYRSVLRPVLPRGLSQWLRRRLLPKPPPPPAPPSEATLRKLADQLAPDVEELRTVLGSDTPLWDLDRAVRRHLEASNGSTGGSRPD